MQAAVKASRGYGLLACCLAVVFLCSGCGRCYFGNGSVLKGRCAETCEEYGDCGDCAPAGPIRQAWGPRYDTIDGSCSSCDQCEVAEPVGCGICKGIGPCGQCGLLRGAVAGSASLVGKLLKPQKWYGTCKGCGEKYWGDVISDPPECCDPCDKQGNWIGPQACVRRRPTLKCVDGTCDTPMCNGTGCSATCTTGGCATGGCTDCGSGGTVETVSYSSPTPQLRANVYTTSSKSRGTSNCKSCNRR